MLVRFLASCQAAGSAKECGETFTGKAALDRMLQQLTEKSAGGAQLTRNEVRTFETFDFLIPEKEKEPFAEIVSKAGENALSKIKKSKPASSTKADKAVAAAAAMFA